MTDPVRRYVVTVRCLASEVELRSDLLWTLGCEAIEEIATAAGATLKASFVDEAAARSLPGEVEIVDDDSWLDQWKAFAEPYTVADNLRIIPSWLDADARSMPGTMLLDPRHAFGYGHATTRLVLDEVARLTSRDMRVLDVGCGSGILMIGALLLGAATALGIDIEPEAVDAAHANAVLNNFADRCEIRSDWPERPGEFNLVLANLLAPILRELAEPINAVISPGGHLVVSGLLAGQWETVEQSYPALRVVRRTNRDGWEAVTLLREAPDTRRTPNRSA